MKTIFVIAFTISFCYSFQPEYIIYKLANKKGDGLILMSKQPDLLAVAPTITNLFHTRCGTGYWLRYNELNYTGYSSALVNWSGDLICYGGTFEGWKSLRYLGPEDSSRQTISIYQNSSFAGSEVVIDSPALTNFPFLPQALFTTGRSNWTLYSEVNFAGNASCYTSTAEYHAIATLNSSLVFNSVLRGCDNRRIDNIIYGHELEVTKLTETTDK